jgi:DNA-binding transcriptional regulator YhcF (GntR family)/DNA-binding LacI/PurR family transcriptional regulator
MLLEKTSGSKSRQIARILTEEIRSGKLEPGKSIYSLRSLANRFTVSTSVINSAYKILEEKSLAVCEQGRGTFVKDNAPNILRSEQASETAKRPDASGCDFALLTSYNQEHIDHYFEAQLEAMSKQNSLCFTCQINDRKKLFLSEKQLEQFRLLSPKYLLVDSDGTEIKLSLLESLRKDFNLIYFNRWLWLKKAHGPAVLNDFLEGCFQAGEYLESMNCERMAVVGFHAKWKDFHLKAACVGGRGFGLKSTSPDFGLFTKHNFQDKPEEIKKFFNPKVKTGIFGLADYNLVIFLEQLEELLGFKPNVEIIGYYNTRWSNRPGLEFSSVKIDYNSLWTNIAKLATSENIDNDTVVWVKPEIIKRKPQNVKNLF